MFLNLCVIYLQPFAFLFPIIGLYLRFDPFVYIFEDLNLPQHIPLWILVIVRYILAAVCFAETCRTFNLILSAVLIAYIVTNKLSLEFTKIKVSKPAISSYLTLWTIHKYGDNMLKYSISLFLGSGFFLCVVFNCFTVIGWKLFPIPFYIAACPITCLIHFLIHAGIPLCVRCHTISFDVIRHLWLRQVCTGSYSRFERIVMTKQLRTLRTITFHSGEVATLDQETRLSYLEYINGKTADVLLVFQSRISGMSKFEF